MNLIFTSQQHFSSDPSILRSTLYDAIDENGVVLMEKTEVDTILTKGKEIIGIQLIMEN